MPQRIPLPRLNSTKIAKKVYPWLDKKSEKLYPCGRHIPRYLYYGRAHPLPPPPPWISFDECKSTAGPKSSSIKTKMFHFHETQYSNRNYIINLLINIYLKRSKEWILKKGLNNEELQNKGSLKTKGHFQFVKSTGGA